MGTTQGVGAVQVGVNLVDDVGQPHAGKILARGANDGFVIRLVINSLQPIGSSPLTRHNWRPQDVRTARLEACPSALLSRGRHQNLEYEKNRSAQKKSRKIDAQTGPDATDGTPSRLRTFSKQGDRRIDLSHRTKA
jgi:hypothetical protein